MTATVRHDFEASRFNSIRTKTSSQGISERTLWMFEKKCLILPTNAASSMPRIPLIILIAIGFILPGCSLQKRSIMPGWHVEKHHQHDAISGAMAEHEPKQEAPNPSLTSSLRVPSSSQPEARMNGKSHDPVIPVKSLMSYSLSVEAAQEKQLAQLLPTTSPLRVSAQSAELITPDSTKTYGLSRFWKLLGALWWGIFGIAMVGAGDAWFLLGIVFLVLSFRSFAWLFASRDEWAKRKSSGIGRRTFFPSQKSSSAQNQVSINHNRTERIKKKAKRQAKRQAFFQAPTTKIAVGFISMMLVYALLF